MSPSPAITVEPGTQRRRLRVLLGAYSCNPESGSEPGVGWHRALETARHCDTWVLCGVDRPAVERWLASTGPVEGLHFHFVPVSRLFRLLSRIPGLLYLGYWLWQRQAFRRALELNREVGFDLVHQFNIGTYREPGYLWKLGLPFVWGPVGGMENYPWRFLGRAGLAGGMSEGLRSVTNLLQFRFSSRVGRIARQARAVLAVNSGVQRAFQRYHGIAAGLMTDVGIEAVLDQPVERRSRTGPLRLLWNGSFLHRKALHLLIEALGRVPRSSAWELRIVGAGPLEERWHHLAQRAGIQERCRWMSWIPLQEAQEQYQWADVLVFTSLRDACGSVVMESLSWGLPVICLDHQGVGDVVTHRCGIKIPVTTPAEVVARLGEAITTLIRDRSPLDRMSVAALERARQYLWTRKVEQTLSLYHQVLAGELPGEDPQQEAAMGGLLHG